MEGPTGSTSTGAPAGPSGYRQSMHAILNYIGLRHYGTEEASMPLRSAEEITTINAHMDEVCAIADRHAEKHNNSPPQKRTPNDILNGGYCSNPEVTVFLAFEESLEWRAYIRGIPPSKRHAATVRRRLSTSMWRAHSRSICLYCWFPANMCLCEELEATRRALPQETLRRTAAVTILLHSEELMRSTNSGHIAAFLLDAPLRVWGIPEDDAYLKQLPAVEQIAIGQSGEVLNQYHVSLYPETNAPAIESFIAEVLLRPPPEGRGASSTEAAGKEISIASGAGLFFGHRRAPKTVHLILSDSTWGQALSLNRHITRTVPRVGLTITDNYHSLFAALRKRTRESGVSTLEATAMAVEQCLKAMGYQAEAELTSRTLTACMKRFVDIRCLLKFSDAQFSDAEALQGVVARRDAARREEATQRLAQLHEKVLKDVRTRQFLLPPVSNYCYCCDCVVGWHRTSEHVLGKTHRAALRQNPTCVPTPESRKCFVPDFARPMREGRSQKA